MSINGNTALYCLFGSPVGHSGSPAFYNEMFSNSGFDAVYTAFDIKRDETADMLNAMRTLHIRGANVTMPCKCAAAELVEELSREAKLSGAVNTIVNRDGTLYGYITDGDGLIAALSMMGEKVNKKSIVITGAGGAARAYAVALALRGAKSVTLINRTGGSFENAGSFMQSLSVAAPACMLTLCDTKDTQTFHRVLSASDILINATPVGMKPLENECPVDTAFIRNTLIVADAVYNPEETKLLKKARQKGCKTISGKDILYFQAEAALRLFLEK